jgi:hypothetical protein
MKIKSTTKRFNDSVTSNAASSAASSVSNANFCTPVSYTVHQSLAYIPGKLTLVRHHTAVTFTADGPFRISWISNSTLWPSAKGLRPLPFTFLGQFSPRCGEVSLQLNLAYNDRRGVHEYVSAAVCWRYETESFVLFEPFDPAFEFRHL